MKENSFVSVHALQENGLVKISIEDNGIGIQKKHIPNIFNMFYRASENSKGSGLGLYIAKETVKKLGGVISVTSEYGKGTTFILGFATNQ